MKRAFAVLLASLAAGQGERIACGIIEPRKQR